VAVGERAQERPNVDSAYTPPNNSGMPPWRTTSRSSIESAPVSMPATIVATLPAALDPLSVGTCSRSRTRPGRSHEVMPSELERSYREALVMVKQSGRRADAPPQTRP
jgi:hypothetical protein